MAVIRVLFKEKATLLEGQYWCYFTHSRKDSNGISQKVNVIALTGVQTRLLRGHNSAIYPLSPFPKIFIASYVIVDLSLGLKIC